jgi:hypothetical protein
VELHSLHHALLSTCTSRPELVVVASIETSDSSSGVRPSDHMLSKVCVRGRFSALAKESLVAALH